MEALYNEHKDLLCSFAWEKAHKTGIDFNEIMAECNFAFMKAYEKYDGKLSKFSTFLTNSCNHRFFNFMKFKIKSNGVDISEVEIAKTEKESLANRVDSLSEDARGIVLSCLEAHERMYDIFSMGGKQKHRRSFRIYMSDKLKKSGWKVDSIKAVMKEIELFVDGF